jgi:hypothetical protein
MKPNTWAQSSGTSFVLNNSQTTFFPCRAVEFIDWKFSWDRVTISHKELSA